MHIALYGSKCICYIYPLAYSVLSYSVSIIILYKLPMSSHWFPPEVSPIFPAPDLTSAQSIKVNSSKTFTWKLSPPVPWNNTAAAPSRYKRGARWCTLWRSPAERCMIHLMHDHYHVLIAPIKEWLHFTVNPVYLTGCEACRTEIRATSSKPITSSRLPLMAGLSVNWRVV